MTTNDSLPCAVCEQPRDRHIYPATLDFHKWTRKQCPNDTNGDGNCGRKQCPHCAPVVEGPRISDEEILRAFAHRALTAEDVLATRGLLDCVIPAAEYDRADARKLGAWVQANLQHHAGKSWSEAIAAEFTGLLAKIEQLECRPLVLCVQRETHVTALVEAQVCGRAEAERRAVARYPKGAKTHG